MNDAAYERDPGRRPSAAEILSLSFREIFGRGFRDYFIPLLVFFFFAGGALLTLRGEMLALAATASSWTEGGLERSLATESMRNLTLRGMTTGLLVALVGSIAALYILRRMRRNLSGGDSSIGEDLLAAVDAPRVASLLVSGLLASLAIAAGYFLLFIPGVLLASVFWLLPACVAFRERGFGLPLAEPFRLASGAFGRQFGVFLVMFIVIFVVGTALMAPMILSQFHYFREAGGEPDALGQLPALFSLGMMAYRGFVALVLSLFYLVLGYASVLLYHDGNKGVTP